MLKPKQIRPDFEWAVLIALAFLVSLALAQSTSTTTLSPTSTTSTTSTTSSSTLSTSGTQINAPGVVYSQLNGILKFNSKTPAIQIQTDAGNFKASPQYSIWGWFKQKDFFTFNSPSNIITLQNVQNFSSGEVEIDVYPNPKFAPCPYTTELLASNPELTTQPNVKDNPNCFPVKVVDVSQLTAPAQNVSITNDEILFINYILTSYDEEDLSKSKYDIQFYLKNSMAQSIEDRTMHMYVIKDLPFVHNVWTFFALSANYETGQLVLYMRVFGENGYERRQDETISFPDFRLNEGSLLLIAATNRNKYFQSLTGYMGEIAYIQMSSYFLDHVQYLWLSEMLVESADYDGVNSEFLYDLYSKKNSLRSYGLDGSTASLTGNYSPLFLKDPLNLGVRFNSNSSIKTPDFQYRSSPFVASHPFLINFSFEETLPESFTLVQKGTPGQTGYLALQLIRPKSGSKRMLRIVARSSNKDFVWESAPIFESDTSYQLLAGLVVSPNRTAHAVLSLPGQFILSEGIHDFQNFDFSYTNLIYFQNDTKFSGHLTVHRTAVLDNFSGGVLQTLETKNSSLSTVNGNCGLRTDYFHGSFGCLKCTSGVNIVSSRSCAAFCPPNFRNNGIGVCVKCQLPNCAEIPAITWTSTRLENGNYRLTPSRPILPSNTDLSQFITINANNLELNKDYTYKITPGNNNEYFDVDFDFKKTTYDQKIDFGLKPDPKTPLFDDQRNLLTGSNLDFQLENICRLKASTSKAIRTLAIVAFFAILASVILGLLILCICQNRMREDKEYRIKDENKDTLSNSLWKFVLHSWMKLQLVAFLLLLNSPLPCCVRIFLSELYKYAVSWAHGMGPVWDSNNKGNANYQNGLDNNPVPQHYAKEGIRAYLLHNMGVVFIFHLVVLVVFLAFIIMNLFQKKKEVDEKEITRDGKVVQKYQGSNKGWFYQAFTRIKWNLVVIGYLMFHMMAFVFSSLNFYFAKFSHPYFIVSFIVALLYMAVFLSYFFFHFFKVLSAPNYYKRPPNFSHYCIFFAGYKPSSIPTKIFGFLFVLAHFLMGLALGLLHFNPFVQIIIILILAVILFVYTVAVRPFFYCIHLVIEIITQFLLIIALIGLTVAIFYERSNCFSCGGREGSLCYLIMISLFLYLLLLALGLALFALMAGCFCSKALDVGKKKDDPEIKDVRYDNVHYNTGGNYDATGGLVGGMAGGMAGAGLMGQGLDRSEHFVNTQTHHTHQTNLIDQEEEIKNNSFHDENRVSIVDEHSREIKRTELTRKDLEHDSYEEINVHSDQELRQVRKVRRDNGEMEHIYGKNWEYLKEQKYGANQYGKYSEDRGTLDKTMTVHPDSDDEPMTQIRVLEALNVSKNAANLENEQEELIRIKMNNERAKMAFEREFTDDERRYQFNLEKMGLNNQNAETSNFAERQVENNFRSDGFGRHNTEQDHTHFNKTSYNMEEKYNSNGPDIPYESHLNSGFNAHSNHATHQHTLQQNEFNTQTQNLDSNFKSNHTKDIDVMEIGQGTSSGNGYFKNTNVKTTRVHSEAIQEQY